MSIPPERGIDHVVFAVRDLDTARARYGRLGFTTTPRADHPFGTSNSLVQLQRNFIELLAVTDPAKLAPAAPGRFSFGAFNAEALKHREGMTMLVFASEDARRDLEEFRSAGLTTEGPVDFSRKATQPNGSQATVAFTLAFVTDPRLPDAAFFVCQQHAPEHFWKPEYQRHGNGATQICEVVLVAEQPHGLADLFCKLQRPEQVHAAGETLRVDSARGWVTVVTPAGFRSRYPGVGCSLNSPRFLAVRLMVQDLLRVESLLKDGDVPYHRDGNRVWIDPIQAMGVVIELTH